MYHEGTIRVFHCGMGGKNELRELNYSRKYFRVRVKGKLKVRLVVIIDKRCGSSNSETEIQNAL